MLWPGVALKIPLFFLAAFYETPSVRSDGNVGCLFSERLCLDGQWCYDDLAFGRCLKPVGDVEEDDLFRYNLEREGLHELSSELRRLFALGYRWSHGYTQCRLQAMLLAFKHELTFEPDSCSHLSDNDLEGALKALEGQVPLDPQEVAIIKYTPSVDDPHAAYADEVYYPPVRNRQQEELRDKILPSNVIDLDLPDPYAGLSVVKRTWIPQMRRRSTQYPDTIPYDPRRKKPDDNDLEFLEQYANKVPEEDETVLIPDDVTELYPVIKFLNDMHLSPREIRQLLSPENEEKLRELLDRLDYQLPQDFIDTDTFPNERFTLTYNTPDSFRAGWESRDTLPKDLEDLPEPRVYYDEADDNTNDDITEYGSGNTQEVETLTNDRSSEWGIFPEVNQDLRNDDEKFRPVVYSEGGVVWPETPENKFKGINADDANRVNLHTLDKLLIKYNLGFKRPERLDVKKPGPPFDPQVAEVAQKAEKSLQKSNEDNTFISMMKKVPVSPRDIKYGHDAGLVKIKFENTLRSQKEGELIYYFIEEAFLTPQFGVNSLKVEPHSISFRIFPQLQNVDLELRDIVQLIDTPDFKEKLEQETGARMKHLEFFNENYVYLEFYKPLQSFAIGNVIIRNITHLLNLEPGTISDARIEPHSIVFKVNANRKKITAGEIATTIASKIAGTFRDPWSWNQDLELKSIGMGNMDFEHFVVLKNPAQDQFVSSMMKKGPPGSNPRTSEFDSDYVYVSFKSVLTDWKQGGNIIRNISHLLHLDPTTFTDGKIDPYMVVFKVKQPNSKGLNSSEVARRIESIKNQLNGVEITSVGVGNKDRMEKVISIPIPNENQFYIVIFMVCGILAACIIASILLIFIRRHLKTRQKLQGLSRPETEPSKDYQDLCRARMASKSQPASDAVHGRITSLSRESEQSPSSRSSTSSWSEEPALHNMDISTGHMVLNYMEDHLKNKDRLDQEWVALCAYVAEPCDTTIAQKKENKDKNRYAEVIPYDHSRVVLNELSNINGSNYINASSITDHDPRNPAYIATQGSLPHTAPDFWQLIWEQGAVVIVMLTRLTEGGAAMCHRYWPEEGSELYHIYEVHLVSEHIWCDDYLVRSFYLKNVRTGETRTVTQFHFLSWPDGGVPSSTKALLEFRRKVNKSYRGRSCPIVVHCSDGAGRTGTYCLIDMVLSRMAKGAKEIDIAATLEHLRDQRPKMVATKQQFEFVLTAVAEEVHAILKALPSQPAPKEEKDK